MSRPIFSWTDKQWYERYWAEFSLSFPSPLPSNTTLSEVAAQLVPVIQKNNNRGCVSALALHVTKMALDYPKDVAPYCQILNLVEGTLHISTLQVVLPTPPELGREPALSFSQALGYFLNEDIDQGLEDALSDDDLGNLAIEPSNIRLTTALLSASTINHGLQFSPRVPLCIIRIGLREVFDAGSPIEPEQSEVFGVVACLHLAVAGSTLMQQFSINFAKIEGGVTAALKLLKARGVFKLPSAMSLLERTIENAESGFTKDISEKEAWNILFPTANAVF